MPPPGVDSSSRARTLSLLHVARLETNWVALGQGGAAAQLIAAMDRDLQALRTHSATAAGTSVCDAIARVLAHVRMRGEAIPQEIDLLMAMAIQFLGRLVREGPSHARGLEGFLHEVDSALREAGVTSERGTRDSRPKERVIRQSGKWSFDLGAAATTTFVDHLFAEDTVRSRLYDSWQLLADEASRLRPHLTSRRTAVVRFRTVILPIDIAVSAEWNVVVPSQSPNSARAIDLLGACVGAPALDAEARQHATVLHLVRGSVEIPVFAIGEGLAAVGDRLCPTSDSHPAEIILVEGSELVLIRPERVAPQPGRGPE